jgi:hypothetical protein
MRRPRKVFGHVHAVVQGKQWHLRMTRDGLLVRQKYGRQVKVVHLDELVNLAIGQGWFKF